VSMWLSDILLRRHTMRLNRRFEKIFMISKIKYYIIEI
jgi:hypothetical protein